MVLNFLEIMSTIFEKCVKVHGIVWRQAMPISTIKTGSMQALSVRRSDANMASFDDVTPVYL